MFFRRIELCKARPLNPCLPIVAARGDLLLLHSILHDPYFGAVVIRSITNHHNLKDRLIRRKIDFVMKLRDERAKFFKKSSADGLQIRLALAGNGLVTRVSPGNVLRFATISSSCCSCAWTTGEGMPSAPNKKKSVIRRNNARR